MYGDNLNFGIVSEQLSDFAQIHIHASRIEVAIISPDMFQGMTSID
jgi:hypothetical protein